MASAGLLALLDDITSLLDDVATMTKVATKKTAGVIGDDLALNANQIAGVCAARELPIVAAVAIGSLVNKAILIPLALCITVLAPWLVTPLLMLGGAFLCFEGAEKTLQKFFQAKQRKLQHPAVPQRDVTILEKERVKGAILTDFILSAEILVIALGAAKGASLAVQALTLCAIGLGMTILVYGSVALIIKADDFGLILQQVQSKGLRASLGRLLGRLIILGAPKLMKLLSIIGTGAMFLVGGEIVVHGIPTAEHVLTGIVASVHAWAPWIPAIFVGLSKILLTVLFGLLVGLILVAAVTVAKKLRS
jgi:predicted DNA repair protein MutK